MQDSFVLHIKFVVKVLAYFIQVIWDSDVFWKIFLPQYDFSMPECASASEDSRFSITENLIVRRELSHIWKLGGLLLFLFLPAICKISYGVKTGNYLSKSSVFFK